MTAVVERFVPALLAGTVVLVALGSSSVDALASFGRTGRWPALLLLAVAAALLAVRRGSLLDAAREPLYLVAGGLVGLAALSVAWSVDPALTGQRAISFGTLVAAAASLGWAARGRPEFAARLLIGLLAGSTAVAAAGLVVLALSVDDAVQAASSTAPFRYRGLGENPNTVSLLVAVALPLALWVVMTAERRREHVFGLASLGLFYGTIVFSGSRGALLAAFVGAVVVALGTAVKTRLRLERAGVAVALLILAVGLSQLPRPMTVSVAAETTPTEAAPLPGPPSGTVTTGSPTGSTTATTPGTPTGTMPLVPYPAGSVGRLTDEVARPATASPRTLFGSSGRVLAWRAALGQGTNRPLLGYGFGTEEVVFVDRLNTFQGDRPENSFVGIYLQLGLAGLALLVAIALPVARRGMRVTRSLAARPEALRVALAAAGVVTAGGLFALVQSYVYSAGNIASLTVWTSLFVLAGAGSWRKESL